MRLFYVQQQHLVDPTAISPEAALDHGATVSIVSVGFAVLSEPLDELAGLIKDPPRKIIRRKRKRSKSTKNSDPDLTTEIGAAFGKESRRIFKQSLEKDATYPRAKREGHTRRK